VLGFDLPAAGPSAARPEPAGPGAASG